jgi:cytochrome c-type biogenesis protein CcmH/NrfG
MVLPRLEMPTEQGDADAPTMAAKPRPKAAAKGARPAPATKVKAKPAPVEPKEPRLFSGGTVAALIAIIVVCSLAGAAGGFWMALSRQKAAPISGPAKARQLLGQANKLLADGDVNEAIPVLEQARDEDPTLAEVQRSLGTAYARLGKEPEAAKAYKFYVTLTPNAEDATEIRTMLARHLGEEQPTPAPVPPPAPPPPASPPNP